MAELGVSMFPTDYAIQPIEFALAAEQRGFESLWFPEHTHIPASRKTPLPGGAELPKEYWHTHDPFERWARRPRRPKNSSWARVYAW